MAKYVVYQVEVTQAEHSIDGKRHKHKYYLYPLPRKHKALKELGFKVLWSYRDGKRGAIKFNSKREALEYCKDNHGDGVEEV